MATKSSNFAVLAELLETYRGRDKVIRLLSYLLELLCNSARRLNYEKLEKYCSVFATQFTNLRILTRLFDDLAMFKWSYTYGLGRKEKDCWFRVFQIIQNSVDQLYYPIEHVAWARDVGLLKGKSDHLWYFGCALWAISLSMSILTTIRKILLLKAEAKVVIKEKANWKEFGNDMDETQEDSCCKSSVQVSNLKQKHKYLLIDLCEYSTDMANAIHWLPNGFLWGGMLPQEIVGLFGTISSICQLYKTLHPLDTVLKSVKIA
eukprot:gene13992-15450_t